MLNFLKEQKALQFNQSMLQWLNCMFTAIYPTYQPAEISEILKLYPLVNRVISGKGSP